MLAWFNHGPGDYLRMKHINLVSHCASRNRVEGKVFGLQPRWAVTTVSIAYHKKGDLRGMCGAPNGWVVRIEWAGAPPGDLIFGHRESPPKQRKLGRATRPDTVI